MFPKTYDVFEFIPMLKQPKETVYCTDEILKFHLFISALVKLVYTRKIIPERPVGNVYPIKLNV